MPETLRLIVFKNDTDFFRLHFFGHSNTDIGCSIFRHIVIACVCTCVWVGLCQSRYKRSCLMFVKILGMETKMREKEKEKKERKIAESEKDKE